ncbi:MAG: hypothetical protein NVSMB46_05430 [Candidatus Saccharimonadales bacterium]
MNLLLLSGNSKRSGEWIKQVQSVLSPTFNEIINHRYTHWDTGEDEINLAHENIKLKEEVRDFEPYAIFAKSAGTILTCMATENRSLNPRWCLFAGLPLAMVHKFQLPAIEWLEATEFPVTIIQHSQDPLGSYSDVQQFIGQLARPNIEVIEVPGTTHDYMEFDLIKSFVDKLLKA